MNMNGVVFVGEMRWFVRIYFDVELVLFFTLDDEHLICDRVKVMNGGNILSRVIGFSCEISSDKYYLILARY